MRDKKIYMEGAKAFRSAAIRSLWNQTLFGEDGRKNPFYFDKSRMEEFLRSIPIDYPMPRERDIGGEMFRLLMKFAEAGRADEFLRALKSIYHNKGANKNE